MTNTPDESAPELVTSTVTVPLADEVPTSESHRVHIDGHLKGPHGAMFKRIRTAMNLSSARLQDGKFVQSNTDTLKCLMEYFEEGLLAHE